MKISPLQIQDLETMQDLSSEALPQIEGGLLLAPKTPFGDDTTMEDGGYYICHWCKSQKTVCPSLLLPFSASQTHPHCEP